MRGIAVELLRDAAHVDAGAAQCASFRHSHARASLRRHPRRAHAAAACADHKKVEFIACHGSFQLK